MGTVTNQIMLGQIELLSCTVWYGRGVCVCVCMCVVVRSVNVQVTIYHRRSYPLMTLQTMMYAVIQGANFLIKLSSKDH